MSLKIESNSGEVTSEVRESRGFFLSGLGISVVILNSQAVLFVGLTAVLLAYFSIWLPGPGAGLQLMGLETAEWLKFMGMGPVRNWFYLPPITLGLMLALLPLAWPPGRRQNWGLRALAALVSLLAFPAVEDIIGPFWREYVIRVAGIGLVTAVAFLSGWFHRRRMPMLTWILLALLGVIGAVMPFWTYRSALPAIEILMGQPVGVGWGLWLNLAGHLWVTAVCLGRLAGGKLQVEH